MGIFAFGGFLLYAWDKYIFIQKWDYAINSILWLVYSEHLLLMMTGCSLAWLYQFKQSWFSGYTGYFLGFFFFLVNNTCDDFPCSSDFFTSVISLGMLNTFREGNDSVKLLRLQVHIAELPTREGFFSISVLTSEANLMPSPLPQNGLLSHWKLCSSSGSSLLSLWVWAFVCLLAIEHLYHMLIDHLWCVCVCVWFSNS